MRGDLEQDLICNQTQLCIQRRISPQKVWSRFKLLRYVCSDAIPVEAKLLVCQRRAGYATLFRCGQKITW